jgi:hypothetical protein
MDGSQLDLTLTHKSSPVLNPLTACLFPLDLLPFLPLCVRLLVRLNPSESICGAAMQQKCTLWLRDMHVNTPWSQISKIRVLICKPRDKDYPKNISCTHMISDSLDD